MSILDQENHDCAACSLNGSCPEQPYIEYAKGNTPELDSMDDIKPVVDFLITDFTERFMNDILRDSTEVGVVISNALLRSFVYGFLSSVPSIRQRLVKITASGLQAATQERDDPAIIQIAPGVTMISVSRERLGEILGGSVTLSALQEIVKDDNTGSNPVPKSSTDKPERPSRPRKSAD